MVGQENTRAMANWSERRGFTTANIEGHFKNDFQRQSDAPSVALFGWTMRWPAKCSIRLHLILFSRRDSGVGHGHLDYRTMRQ